MTDIALQLVDVLKTHDSGAQKVVALDRVDFTLERVETARPQRELLNPEELQEKLNSVTFRGSP